MSFAYWRKCDFQVHSPRDPNWNGQRPVGLGDPVPETGVAATEEDVRAARKSWAAEFIDACIAKDLQAVALTDHHEMIMLPFVQSEIQSRKEHDANFDLWIFPGMELTANGGKQCLILFDAGLPENWWQQAQGQLGIAFAANDGLTAQGPPVTQLALNYADLGKQLNEIEELRGRYVILPNVSQGGGHTVLVNGAHADFKRMPFVGGYLDSGQTINTLGPRNKQRLSGTDPAWGDREIYPLPTSDSRSDDFATLGGNGTWIKLAQPTAEAIRQAFLGNRSRIAISLPQTPTIFVAEIKIDNSSIFAPTEIALSPELSSFIGGRGSGKSTMLEYLSFGLGRSCYDMQRPHYSVSERLSDLIADTLISKNGSVSLTIFQDNARFEIVRNAAKAYQPRITYPDGTQQTVTLKELRSLFPAVVYSQGELAELGKKTDSKTQLTDLLQFVDLSYKHEDDDLAQQEEAAKSAVKKAIRRLAQYWSLLAKLRKKSTERDNLRQRVEALERTLPELDEKDQATVARFEAMNEFEAKRIQASKHSDRIISELEATSTELEGARDLKPLPNEQETEALTQAYLGLYGAFETGLNGLLKDLRGQRENLSKIEAAWVDALGLARTARDAVLEKLGEHKAVTDQIIKLREQVSELTNQIGDLETELKSFANPDELLATAEAELLEVNSHRASRTQEWAKEIELLSSGTIKADVNLMGDVSALTDATDQIAAKTGSKESTRRSSLSSVLKNSSAADVRGRITADCLSILYWRLVGATEGQDEPACAYLCGIMGETDKIRLALFDVMDTERVEAIATAVTKPEITLSYSDGKREISFEKASEGQRAAALLFMLLDQPGGPLVIDQPEGDLDNNIITDLTEKLHDAKQKRQIVFASHNANIVVNGSSELVGHLDTAADGNRYIDHIGAIDAPNVRDVITTTMEGGKKAFKDRQKKYGY